MRLDKNDSEVIDTINCYGKYRNAKPFKAKLLSIFTLLLFLACFVVFVFLF